MNSIAAHLCAAVALMTVLLAPAVARAQVVVGDVIDRDGSTRIGGVVVLLLDAEGRVAAQALSRPDGGFVLRAPSAGVYRVRALRIGYGPTESAPFSVSATGTTRAPVTLAGAPVRLDSIRVVGRRECAGHRDSTQAAFRVWEELRKALAATALTSAQPYDMQLLTIKRRLDRAGRVRGADSTIRSGPTNSSFTSLSADSLERVGYVVRHGSELVFHGPDATALLAEPFAATHCMRLVHSEASTGERAGWLGLAFEPVARRSVADIEGTIWLDPRSAELRELEFRYVGGPRLTSWDRGGGRVSFMRLPTGGWIVRDFALRMPVSTFRADETAGEVMQVARDGRLVWARRVVSITLRLLDSANHAPIVGARLWLVGIDRSVTTDSTGRAAFDSIPPGTYRLRVSLPAPAAASERERALDLDVPIAPRVDIEVRVPLAPRQRAEFIPFAPSRTSLAF